MSREITGYDVGALMYCPANGHKGIVDALREERFSRPFSLAFCLEDTVREDAVELAERELYQTLERITAARFLCGSARPGRWRSWHTGSALSLIF